MQDQSNRALGLWEPNFRANVGNFVNGPSRYRPCRDIWCLLILALMFGGLLVVSYKTLK